MKARLVRFIQEDDGQDLIEYALLGGLIITATVAAITAIGIKTNSLLSTLCTTIGGASC